MESNTPQLLTMPLRFRVWNKSDHSFMTIADAYPLVQMAKEEANRIDFSLQELASLLDNSLYYDDNDDYITSQDTGLKDKDGRSIYTGDIVQITKTKYDKIDRVNHIEESTLPVVYEHGRVALKVDRLDEYGGAYWVLLSMQRPRDLQALGNIWQNPELLEGECCE